MRSFQRGRSQDQVPSPFVDVDALTLATAGSLEARDYPGEYLQRLQTDPDLPVYSCFMSSKAQGSSASRHFNACPRLVVQLARDCCGRRCHNGLTRAPTDTHATNTIGHKNVVCKYHQHLWPMGEEADGPLVRNKYILRLLGMVSG